MAPFSVYDMLSMGIRTEASYRTTGRSLRTLFNAVHAAVGWPITGFENGHWGRAGRREPTAYAWVLPCNELRHGQAHFHFLLFLATLQWSAPGRLSPRSIATPNGSRGLPGRGK